MPALLELEEEMEKTGGSKSKDEKVSLGKRLMLEELEKEFASSENAFFSRFEKLNVQDLNELRRNLEKVARRTMLVKHTLAKKVFEKMKLSDAERFLEGTVLVTLGAREPQLASKTLVDFIKGRENVELRGMILDGKAFDGSFIKELAKLPSRKELLTQVAIRMKSPIAGLVMTLRSLLQSFVVVLNEIQKKKAQEA
jgi:large subunit ribosomal protein L10